MEKLGLEGVNIFYIGVAIWGSNAEVAALFTVARCLVSILLSVLLLSLLHGILGLFLELPGLSLEVSNLALSHR